MTEFADFKPVPTVRVDDRRRIPLGKTSALPGDTFAISQRADGAILLVPVPAKTTSERT
ncbi:hypothetical protein [Actinophytocola sp.]|uniref:hypothetical protein n=1 Tax=Actinophytocola sp. TaxID=1872138 RepID=UPI002ECFEAE6